MTKLSIFVVPISWVVGAIVAVILYFALKKGMNVIWTKSYVLGLVTALLNFGLTISFGRGFIREVNRADGAPVRRSIIGYIVRLLIAGLVFAFVIYDQFSSSARFNVIPTLIGYMTVKIVIIIVSLIINSKGKVST